VVLENNLARQLPDNCQKLRNTSCFENWVKLYFCRL